MGRTEGGGGMRKRQKMECGVGGRGECERKERGKGNARIKQQVTDRNERKILMIKTEEEK